MKDKQPIPANELGLSPQEGLPAQNLPRELVNPTTADGQRYGKLPTSFQNPDKKIGRVFWITEPGTEEIEISTDEEGSLVGLGIEFINATNAQASAEKRVKEVKEKIKKGLGSIPGATGLYYEKIGVDLTNIEQITAVIPEDREAELRERLGPEFYDLAEQEVSLVFELTRRIVDITGKPVTPEYLTELTHLVLTICLGNSEEAASLIKSKTKTTVDKEVAADLYIDGKLQEGDLKFVSKFALTPDAKPKTAPRKQEE